MINYIEKGTHLHSLIHESGHTLSNVDGAWISSDDVAVQAIIDTFDPLPQAQEEATNRINEAAGETRTKYVTAVPSQDATYQMKLEDAKAFMQAGYPEEQIANYPFIAGEAIATGTTGQVASDLIIATALGWTYLASSIENERRRGNEAVSACTVWSDCSVLADTAVNNLSLI